VDTSSEETSIRHRVKAMMARDNIKALMIRDNAINNKGESYHDNDDEEEEKLIIHHDNIPAPHKDEEDLVDTKKSDARKRAEERMARQIADGKLREQRRLEEKDEKRKRRNQAKKAKQQQQTKAQQLQLKYHVINSTSETSSPSSTIHHQARTELKTTPNHGVVQPVHSNENSTKSHQTLPANNKQKKTKATKVGRKSSKPTTSSLTNRMIVSESKGTMLALPISPSATNDIKVNGELVSTSIPSCEDLLSLSIEVPTSLQTPTSSSMAQSSSPRVSTVLRLRSASISSSSSSTIATAPSFTSTSLGVLPPSLTIIARTNTSNKPSSTIMTVSTSSDEISDGGSKVKKKKEIKTNMNDSSSISSDEEEEDGVDDGWRVGQFKKFRLDEISNELTTEIQQLLNQSDQMTESSLYHTLERIKVKSSVVKMTPMDAAVKHLGVIRRYLDRYVNSMEGWLKKIRKRIPFITINTQLWSKVNDRYDIIYAYYQSLLHYQTKVSKHAKVVSRRAP
jgi:hypothetical protein